MPSGSTAVSAVPISPNIQSRPMVGASVAIRPMIGETIMPSCCRLVPMPTQKSDPEIECQDVVDFKGGALDALPAGTPIEIFYTEKLDSAGRASVVGNDSPGAVDNASGTAGLLELARIWGAGPRPERSVVMISFTREERPRSG